MTTQSRKVIIIGSGIAGMAAAIRLAVKGYDVTVYEANAYPGGKLALIEKDGYRFDAGPSLFTQPSNVEELFEIAGEPINDYFNYHPVDIACRYFFENGKVINAYTDPAALADELAEKNNEKSAAIKNYLHHSERLYENIGNIFLNHSLHKRSTWFSRRIFKALGTLKFSYLFSTLHHYNKKRFSSPETIQLFNRFATYNGSNPYKAPGMLSLIPHIEHNQGIFYPAGGMVSIAGALYKLAVKKGVQFNFNAPVDRIIHSESKIAGVVVKNENIYAPVVISNADVYFTFKKLLKHLPAEKKFLKKERSSSAIVFYWGIKKQFPELHLHNILFSNNYKEEFEAIFKRKSVSKDPTVYINITSKMETGHAPSGRENWFVMINAPSNYGQDWEKIKLLLRTYIIEKINRMLQTDIEPLIETEEIVDPVSIENKTGSFMGSIYGNSSNSKLSAFYRPPNFTGYARGLYFCGGTVHPGGGIPLCFKSAKIVSAIIERDNQHKRSKQY